MDTIDFFGVIHIQKEKKKYDRKRNHPVEFLMNIFGNGIYEKYTYKIFHSLGLLVELGAWGQIIVEVECSSHLSDVIRRVTLIRKAANRRNNRIRE